MEIKITPKQLQEKSALVYGLIKTEDDLSAAKTSKLQYAVQKFNKLSNAAQAKVNEKIEDIRIDNAAEDDKGIIIMKEYKDSRGETQFKKEYTKEGEKKLNSDFKNLMETEITFDTYIFSNESVIATFDEFVVEELRGVFFPEIKAELSKVD